MDPLKFYIHINDSIENLINWSVKETRGLDYKPVQTAARLNGLHNTSCIWIGRTPHSHKVVLFSLTERLLPFAIQPCFSSPIPIVRATKQRRATGCSESEVLLFLSIRANVCCFTSAQDPLRHVRQTQTRPPVQVEKGHEHTTLPLLSRKPR